jgi:superfamily I DNA and/or RNA helicase
MHSGLARVPSREFYGGRVYTGIEASETASLYEFPNPGVPMLFVDVASREQKSSDGVSILNLMKILRVAEIENKLAAVGVSADQISVINSTLLLSRRRERC